MILSVVVEKYFSPIFGPQGGIGATCQWSYHVEEIDTVV